jgi:hypothetical protein
MLNAVGDPAELRRVLKPGGHVLVANSFFETPPAIWFERWRELGFEPLGTGNAGGGHWELFSYPGGEMTEVIPTRSSPAASRRRRGRPG